MILVIVHEIGHVYMVTCFNDWSEDMATLTGFSIFTRIFRGKGIIEKDEFGQLIGAFTTLGILTDAYLGITAEAVNSRMKQYIETEQEECKLNSKYQEFLKKEEEFRQTF